MSGYSPSSGPASKAAGLWRLVKGAASVVWIKAASLWPPGSGGSGSGRRLAIAREDRDRVRERIRQALDTGAGPVQAQVEPQPSPDETALLVRLREETRQANRNNVERTAAYGAFYRRFPEVHWALLAHLVSRSGGYSMTDLRGELLPLLLDAGRLETTFRMLERSNAFIFGDAYPQLLLYEESRRRGRPLFHLLPALGVSRFMRPVWEDFWQHGTSALLTVSLIVNEQSYIQGRVVDDPVFRRQVLETPTAAAQRLLQLNQVVLPWLPEEPPAAPAPSSRSALRLYGRILEDFTDLEERIAFGRQLYALLFAAPGVLTGAERFAGTVPHTGSRADYWPQLYTAAAPAPAQKASPSKGWTERLDRSGSLRAGAPRFYSPALTEAWPDRPLEQPAVYDWCRGPEAIRHLDSIAVPEQADLATEASLGLRKLELAVQAGRLTV
ncbi:hypothetical protein J31TS4_40210 [Paenibacillus sp. J31TS4]|uniref:DUF2515 family protein n=1 Tax=Paenibacillus sp. J31TS4 TaxID=2807195 RepID=UPI001B03E636|nr:DUF2515 family protein [Paenibacillus sp. J31TS4]GIP40741.1 hypothetical protein J31TS4_40210 [Paenibacillus sp. J31TS4]